jgi:hypothetical protein
VPTELVHELGDDSMEVEAVPDFARSMKLEAVTGI